MRKILFATVAMLGLGGALLPATPVLAAQNGTVVSPKLPLNVRAGSAVWTARVRSIANGSAVSIACQTRGQLINRGTMRVTDLWDRLADGSYVSDAWIKRAASVPPCAAPAATAATATTAVSVASGPVPLRARSGPAHTDRLVATLPDGTALNVVCQQPGEKVVGSIRATDMWNRLTNGLYVSDAYVRRSLTPLACPAAVVPPLAAPPVPPAPAGVWTNPVPGFSAQPGFRTERNPNHLGVDLMAFIGTPIRAASAGTVVEVVCNIEAGHSCDLPGSAAVRGCGWYVKLQHADGVSTLYCHMVHRGVVQPGQRVVAGQVIGYVGTSGNSSAPHLHFEVHVATPPTSPANAVDPLPFMRARHAPVG